MRRQLQGKGHEEKATRIRPPADSFKKKATRRKLQGEGHEEKATRRRP
jgi:hypothetical protein